MMPSDLVFYLYTCVFFILLCLLFCRFWPGGKPSPAVPKPPRRKREPKPFAGYTRKPECEWCEQQVPSPPQTPGAPPPRMIFTRGRRRQVDTTGPFCPPTACSYPGRVGLGHSRANGHPKGRRWRQLGCLGCPGSFLEPVGPLCHGQPVDPDQLVWAIAARAEGLGIRAVARVFETDPHPVLTWGVEAAEHLQAVARHGRHDLHVEQVQMDELVALLSAITSGEITESEAIQRLSRSPNGVGVAMAPFRGRFLTKPI